jgi:hypothetical protein
MGQFRRLGRWIVLAVVCVISSSREAGAQEPEANPALGVISGTISLEDGTPSKTKGSLHSELRSTAEPGNPNSVSHSSASEGEFRDKFSVRLKPGTVWLKFFVKGYAPACIGPFEISAGQTIETAKIVLSPGVQRKVRVVSADGKPVPRAKILALPWLGPNSNGPNVPSETNERGEYLFEHLADAPHSLHITAPGHEPFRVEKQLFSDKEVTELRLTPSLPATGLVLNPDNTPAKDARILFRCEIPIDGTMQASGYGFGEELATTDAAGRFTLDSLTRGSTYLFIVESTDKQRIAVRTLRAGLEGVQVRLPKDQNLRVKLIGDISSLPKRKNGPFIGVRQRLTLEGPTTKPGLPVSRGDLIGEDATVTPTEDGGGVDYTGLLSGAVEINVAGKQQTFNVVDNGLTEVTIDLDKDKAN